MPHGHEQQCRWCRSAGELHRCRFVVLANGDDIALELCEPCRNMAQDLMRGTFSCPEFGAWLGAFLAQVQARAAVAETAAQ